MGLVALGYQMFSQLYLKIKKVPPLFFPTLVYSWLAVMSHIFPQLLCMLCLRISFPSCSQAGKTPQLLQFSHVKSAIFSGTQEKYC